MKCKNHGSHAACSSCRPEIFKTPKDVPDNYWEIVELARIYRIEDMLIDAKHNYYCLGQEVMDDKRYDFWEQELRKLKPDSKIFTEVGCLLCYEDEI